ncbi:hypothetical protein [Haloprofundus salinisoli]|uniref:hypothetical protein n=1 Tax=Haloprofundus salinisoli TaxID=2876193 RepID=UPI001CCDC08C|nr:hypothetical protein [Haloprofundus salinisoli]
MRRRTFLATAATALGVSLAGCAQPAASLYVSTADEDDELAERTSRQVTNQTAPVVHELATSGSVTIPEDEWRPDTTRVTEHEGRYYTFSDEVVDVERRKSYTAELDLNPPNTEGQSVELSALPEPDRELVGELLELRDVTQTGDGPEIGGSRVYSVAEEEQSELVPEPAYEFVVVDDETYGLSIGDSEYTQFRTYRYTAEEVAGSTAEYAGQIRDEYLFTLSGLSNGERDLFETAIEEQSVFQEDEATEAFRSLADEIHAHKAFELTEDRASGWYSGQWVLEYEGAVYWVTVDHNDWDGE